jgi:hypothetical protein
LDVEQGAGTNELRRATKANVTPAARRAVKPAKPRQRKAVSQAAEPDIFGGSMAAKPEHPSVGHLLPFLEERISFRMPSDIKLLDGVLEYLNERMLRLGLIQPGFKLCNVPDPTDPCRLLEPNGRGLYLINHIMDEVRFNDAGNQLVMVKRISRREEPDSADKSI